MEIRSVRWLAAVLLAAACLGCGEGGLTGSAPQSGAGGMFASDLELSPAQVVAEQMEGLSAWRDDFHASQRVFSFASPGNRAVTGPIEHFEELMESAPYQALTSNQGYVVGKAVEAGDAATVLVTLIDRSGALLAYRFYLSRQKNEPRRRWMTDAVYRFSPDNASAAENLFPTI